MLFGLACEGVTDQITLENILCGYFENPNLDDEIIYLQPFLDETDQKRSEGGWRMLLQYLASSSFRTAVLNTEFIVLQIDTDISEEFEVITKNNEGVELSIDLLIENVKLKLIENINAGELGFYEKHSIKIIFAISVHSLECWLVAHHAGRTENHNCFDILKSVINQNDIRVAKKPKNYKTLSLPFLDCKNIEAAAEKNFSFRVFIQSLESIELP